MPQDLLYVTKILNQSGIEGKSYVIEPTPWEVEVSSPLSSQSGTNPEQLLGLALATCLNATIEAEYKRRGLVHQSSVDVTVALKEDEIGFRFGVLAEVSIKNLSDDEAMEIFEIAKDRCPMHKLLEGNSDYQVRLI